MAGDSSSSQIADWRSIVTLIVFVLANVNVLFPYHIPIYIPRRLCTAFLNTLSYLRIISPREAVSEDDQAKAKSFVRFKFPMNSVTAPLLANLFLLAILAIGRQEIHDGILGSDNIFPIDIMTFFLTLAYIAVSIDASGLIKYLALKVLQYGGKVGHRLFFFLYSFFFILGSFIGNDPIILSGTAFLAYITRVSSNIIHPQAWIHTQFAIANIASAILVSSNPANLVLAGAFNIKFIDYTANMVVPVIFTAIILFPFLLYVVFANDTLIPYSIILHELPEDARAKTPINPNIPNTKGYIEESDLPHDEQNSLEEIMNPYLDKASAAFGAVMMAVTLITVLVLNAVFTGSNAHPVFWVTLPAAFVMFCWDLAVGWYHREESRQIARTGRREMEDGRAKPAIQDGDNQDSAAYELVAAKNRSDNAQPLGNDVARNGNAIAKADDQTGRVITGRPNNESARSPPEILVSGSTRDSGPVFGSSLEASGSRPTPRTGHLKADGPCAGRENSLEKTSDRKASGATIQLTLGTSSSEQTDARAQVFQDLAPQQARGRTTLVSLARDAFRWLQETFPTATAVVVHLPLPLVPFAFSMFILVQALVNKGWVRVFAYGWDHWASRTGTIGAIGGMGFLSAVLCNFSGTNVGTTILLSRVIQMWAEIHVNETPISNRTFWATVYSMALGVNYGAFSTTFSASLAGLLWRDILSRKNIYVRRREFARVNLPIITIAMVVGCTVLIGEVYISRDETPYTL